MSFRVARVVASLATAGALGGGGFTLRNVDAPVTPPPTTIALVTTTTVGASSSPANSIDRVTHSIISQATLLEQRISAAKLQLQSVLQAGLARDASAAGAAGQLALEQRAVVAEQQQLAAEATSLAKERASLAAEARQLAAGGNPSSASLSGPTTSTQGGTTTLPTTTAAPTNTTANQDQTNPTTSGRSRGD